MTRRGIPMCRDWRVRYVDVPTGTLLAECIVSAPTKMCAKWNARDKIGWPALYMTKVTAWPMPKAKPLFVHCFDIDQVRDMEKK